MSKELVIASNRHETKVALLEDDQLVEVFFQRSNEYSLAGSIHKGRVTRVLPGMQSAFVDLGLERDTFLYVSDFFEEGDSEDFDRVTVSREDRRPEREPRAPEAARNIDPARATDAPRAAEELSGPSSDVPEAEAGGPGAADATAQAPRLTSPFERTDDSDRRGRRSRRRRNRGRGFPDSKYAPTESRYVNNPARPSRMREALPGGAATEEQPASAESVTEPPSPSSDTSEFSVLPGESLAKYRSNVAPLDEAEEHEIRSLQDAADDNETPEEDAVAEALVTPEEEPGTPFLETPPPLPASELARLVTHQPVAMEPATAGVEPPAPVEEEEESEPTGELSEAMQEVADQSEPSMADEPESDESSDDGIEQAGASPESETETEAAEAVEATSAAENEGLAPAPTETGAAGTGLTAQVRGEGGRYMHRSSRRMRRKMRGGGPGEGRGDGRGEGRYDSRRQGGEAAPPVEGATEGPIARPEPSRVVLRQDRERPPLPSITELLKEGQEIIVQIAKEPLGQKGARITSHIALPGRYVVFMPTLEHTGVSRKIASDDERLRLKKILQTHAAGIPGGFIVRTAGEGKTEDELAADMNFLFNLWMDIRQKAEKRPAPLLLHHDLDIVQRTLRDQLTEQFKAIWVDNEELYESVLRFVQRFQPALVSRVKLYTRPEPIFDAFNITAELEKALRPKVWLKSGGHIVINQTEALVAVDVNTGKYVGKSHRLEDTIVKTNTEAVKEIVRQIRLRDLGGIIVVDFIDMDERKNRQKVMQTLEDAMRTDRAPYKILQFNDFGLVAITRKRVKQSLERALCMPCPHCEGAGYVKSVQTVVSEILQEAHKLSRVIEGKDVILRVHPDVGKFLKSNQNKYLEELEEILRRPVLVRADPLLHNEKFDLA